MEKISKDLLSQLEEQKRTFINGLIENFEEDPEGKLEEMRERQSPIAANIDQFNLIENFLKTLAIDSASPGAGSIERAVVLPGMKLDFSPPPNEAAD